MAAASLPGRHRRIMQQRRSRNMSRTGVVIYTNEQGWSLETGPKYIQVRNPDEEFVTGWDLERMTMVEHSEGLTDAS